jgi:hypothetical protein
MCTPILIWRREGGVVASTLIPSCLHKNHHFLVPGTFVEGAMLMNSFYPSVYPSVTFGFRKHNSRTVGPILMKFGVHTYLMGLSCGIVAH